MNKIDWIEQWLLLWPLNIESGHGPIRSKAEHCVNKMQKLCNSNNTYTKDVIFAATKMYLKEREADNYAYTKRATYFIDKLKEGSLLENYCDKILAERLPPDPDEIPVYNSINDFI